MRRTRLLQSVLMLLLCLALFSCAREQEPGPVPEQGQGQGRIPEVVVAPVHRGPILKAYTSVGSVAPREIARIGSKISGRIEEIPVDEGDRVKRGETLMLIDPFDYERALASAEAQLSQARASLERARRDLARMEALYKTKAVSEQSYQDALTARDLALFQHDQAATARELAGENLKECRLGSPIPGIVTEVLVNEGELTGPQQPAFVVMDMDTVKVETDLPEEIFSSVRVGNTSLITADALPGQTFEGTITRIYPTVDAVSRTFRVTITLDNPGLRLRPGMTARSQVVQTMKPEVLTVPREAIFRGEEGYLVYTFKDGAVDRVPISTGIQGDTLSEVVSGLSENDLVVVRGIAGLKPGMRVSVEQGAPAGN